MIQSLKVEKSWRKIISTEFKKKYIQNLDDFLDKEQKKYNIFPKKTKIFYSLNMTPFEKIKVVIIGQDPYHGHGQAHGLAFSVTKGMTLPPTLKNIFKEINNDLYINNYKNGDLTKWSKQGVLLLNSILTVRENKPSSHQNKGWERLTDNIISSISKNKKNIIFILWGKFAQKKKKLIDSSKHHILKSSHPSPLSAHISFFGCKHFSKCNKILKKLDKSIINWEV